MPQLVQPLPDGPLDVIGDVHGEIVALRRLLDRLGCDPDRGTAERPLVFVGDLVDRGPDSPAVVRLVRDLAERGLAWCIAGNHELNLLQEDGKEGNGWYFGHDDGYPYKGRKRHFGSREVTDPDEREELRAYLATLPVALVRDDLRIVHACWDHEAIVALPREGDLKEVADVAEGKVLEQLASSGVLARAERERQHFKDLRDPDLPPTRDLPNAREMFLMEQRLNPYRVLTSGKEHPIPVEETFYVGGKWRLVERSKWWEAYTEAPAVIVGHYWRRRSGAIEGKRDLWDDVAPFAWAGPRHNVFCVDYSVGRRFLERWRYADRAIPEPWTFRGSLAALRWPERTLVFDDREAQTPTTGFGR